MTHDDHRAKLTQVVQRFIQFSPCRHIEISVRLIKQQESGLPDDGPGQEGALPLSTTQFADRPMCQRCQCQTLHDLRHNLCAMFFLPSGGEQTCPATASHHLSHRDGKRTVHLCSLGQNSHTQPLTPLHHTGLRLQQPCHDTQQGSLAAPIAPREHPHLTFANIHGDVAHHHMMTIGNSHLAQRKQYISFHLTKLWRYATTLPPSHTTRDSLPAPRLPPLWRWHWPLCHCVRAAQRRYAHLRFGRSE